MQVFFLFSHRLRLILSEQLTKIVNLNLGCLRCIGTH